MTLDEEIEIRRTNLVLIRMAEVTLDFVHDSAVSAPELAFALKILRGVIQREAEILEPEGDGIV